jgi:hypothetical protein
VLDDAAAASRTAVDMDRAVDVLVDQASVFDGAPRRFSFEIFRREIEHRRGNRVFEHRVTRYFRFTFLQFFIRYADHHSQTGNGILS